MRITVHDPVHLHTVVFAPPHQPIEGEPTVSTVDDLHLRPSGSDLGDDALEYAVGAETPIDVRRSQAGCQQIAFAEEVQRQVAIVVVVPVEEPPS